MVLAPALGLAVALRLAAGGRAVVALSTVGLFVLLTGPVLMCAAFFVLSSFSLISLQSFAVPVMAFERDRDTLERWAERKGPDGIAEYWRERNVATIDGIPTGMAEALAAVHGARDSEGKSGGYRTLIFFRHEERAIFAFGFAKSDKANLSPIELRTYKEAAKIVLALTQAQIDTEVREGRLFEVNDNARDL